MVVVDDESIVVEGIREILKRENMNCRIVGYAYDGLRGLEVIRETMPDIVVTDIRMPGRDGLSLIEECKRFLPGAYYVIISGYAEFEYARRALLLEVINYIDKPVTIARLREVMAQLEQKRERSGEQERAESQGRQEKKEAPADRTGSHHRIIKWVLEYLEENYDKNPGLNELADRAELNPAYLSLLFKEEVGVSFVKYLTELRMGKARELLDAGYRVGEVSEMVGYSNYRYFCDIFKKHEGKTPNEYKGCTRKRQHEKI